MLELNVHHFINVSNVFDFHGKPPVFVIIVYKILYIYNIKIKLPISQYFLRFLAKNGGDPAKIRADTAAGAMATP
jgi:hypothetical protein